MNQRELIILSFGVFIMLFLSNFSLAANDTISDTATKAYKCLENQTKGRTDLSLAEATFSALALGSYGKLVSQIESYRDSSSCWPKNACKLKETAQVLLAYKRINKENSAIKNWILSKNATSPDLRWFLEIDITNKAPASCTIEYGITKSTIKILDNMKIQGSAGSCLAIDNSGFMLRINNNCLKNEFKISCDQDFITSVLYQKNTGGTFFVLPDAHATASLGLAKESANGECLRTSGACDYEGTLWATLALQKAGEDTSRFMPYLLALAEDNPKFFPGTFLYILVGGEEQYKKIIQEQKQGKFWEITTGTRFYDTSLAMMALSSTSAGEFDSAKSYLSGIQTKEGCWNSNSIRDTSFILYSGWGKNVPGESGGGGAVCEIPYSCENSGECTSTNGTIVEGLECPGVQICCTVAVKKERCEEKGGLICISGKECQDGYVESASDGTCCMSACINIISKESCTHAGGECRISCFDDENENTEESCATTEGVCCFAKGGLWGWIVLLIILIGIVILGIIYRAKLKIWWFKLKEKFRKKPTAPPPARPMASAARPVPFMPFARFMPQQRKPVVRDRGMEEALRKLREMSKK